MSEPAHERAPHYLPTAQPRRPSRPLLITSIALLAIWAAAVMLIAFHIL